MSNLNGLLIFLVDEWVCKYRMVIRRKFIYYIDFSNLSIVVNVYDVLLWELELEFMVGKVFVILLRWFNIFKK